jgi:glycine/D-amino acid oxidase-like deaminating enzyme
VPLLIDLPRSADVVIIGGGFAGMATAWALRERGVTDVVVVEREADLGRFASGRAAGLGRQLAEDDALTALTVRGATVLRAKFPQAWTETGGVLSFDNHEYAQAYVERAARFGVPVNALTRDMVLGHWPALDTVEIVTALHIPSDGVIDVKLLLDSLARDVAIGMNAGVDQIVPMNGGARVVTARGDVVARIVVDATGAWAGHIVGDPPLESFKRHVFTLDARAVDDSPFLWHLGACELYVRGAAGDVLVSPCDAALVPPGDQRPDPDGETKLRRALAGSSLETAPIVRGWACQRTFTPSGEMKLGRDPSRSWLVHAVGLGGHGATAAPAVGETVAAVVASAL